MLQTKLEPSKNVRQFDPVMAAGRGEFYRHLATGLQMRAALQPQCVGHGRHLDRVAPQGHRTKSCTITKPAPANTLETLDRRTPKNPFERLPSEILMKILSYLDATSLYLLSYVNKVFRHLANDDLLWYEMYTSEFGVTQPQWITASRPRVTQGSPTGLWKQKYFKALAGQDLRKWRVEQGDVNPFTGLPHQTAWVLRKLKVCWKLRAKGAVGQEVELEPSKVYFFETSSIVRWSSDSFPYLKHLRNLELHGLRKETHIVKKPPWTSLMLRWITTDGSCVIGKDRLIKLLFLSPGFVVGIFRGQNVIAFVMVCLHFHKLLERSLFGSPVNPYMEPTVRLGQNMSESKFGLLGYNLHFVLHNTEAEIMSEYFPDLSCRPASQDLLALDVIDENNLSQHLSLSGNIRLSWKTEELDGSVENCCFMTLTLLDVFQKPFWCVCAPITIVRSHRSPSFDYNGDRFLMDYRHAEGAVQMKLVWLKEQKQFFLINLTVFVPKEKVNRYFCTNY